MVFGQVWHAPKEETGGGSAWGAGLIYGLRAGPQWQDPRTADLQVATHRLTAAIHPENPSCNCKLNAP